MVLPFIGIVKDVQTAPSGTFCSPAARIDTTLSIGEFRQRPGITRVGFQEPQRSVVFITWRCGL
jgi:hypothetical protein